MSDLSAFRDHAARMAAAEHKPECIQLRPRVPVWAFTEDQRGMRLQGFSRPEVACPGCVTDADRALWLRLADEVDAYLSREPEATLL